MIIIIGDLLALAAAADCPSRAIAPSLAGSVRHQQTDLPPSRIFAV